MANFYAKVKHLVNDCDTSYVEPLSYLKHFTAENSDTSSEKVVLLYKRGLPSTPPRPKQVKQQTRDNDTNLLDLTGSPLRDSCQFDLLGDSMTDEFLLQKNEWTDDEEQYQTIPLSDAQSHFNQILIEFKTQSTPKCWSICESSDKTLLMSIQLKNGKCCRGILKFNGIIDFAPINMAEIQAKHLSYVVKQYGSIEGMVDGYYRLGSDAMLQVSHLVNGSMPQSILTDGKNSAKMILHQTVSINKIRSPAQKFWIQLGILDNIKETIVAYKETKDSNKLVFNSFISNDIADIKKEIYDMLTQPIPIGVTDEDDLDDHKPNTNIDQIVQNAVNRVSVELTDQLWDSLKTCSSYDTLKEAIQYLFTSAAKINVVNMPSSQSRLAHLIRDVSEHRIAIPILSGSEPLELLLEIGLEKVNKDYEFIFMESKLCTGEELRADKKLVLTNSDLNVRKSLKTQFSANGTSGPPRKTLMHKMSENMELNDSKEKIGFQNSKFNLKTIEADLARLGRIHLILEHLIMIKVNLNLENVFTTFLEDLRKPLVPFNALKEMQTDFRAIPVTNTKILTKIANIPNRLRVFFKSRNHFKIIRNTFYFSTDPIFPSHVFKCIETNDTKLDVYFSHQYLEIESV